MLLGHGLLAFALVAAVAAHRGVPRRRALAIGAVAGAFGTLPDVDMLYALWGALGADGGGLLAANEAFWSASRAAHRSATHSLVLGVPTAVAAGLLVRRRGIRGSAALAAGLFGAVVLAGALGSGPVDAVMLSAFVVGAVVLALLVRRFTDLGWRATTVAAGVGLLAHPWGDLFTGTPPDLLYPLGFRVFETRFTLPLDPTYHLLFVFALEIVAVWAAATVYLRFSDRSPTAFVDRRAALGAVYAGAVPFVPAPSVAVPSAFVVSILGVGILLSVSTLLVWPQSRRVVADGGDGTPAQGGPPTVRPTPVVAAVLTGTATVTVAWVAYLGAYLGTGLVV